MKILVTFAVAAEFAAWRQRHDFYQLASDPFPLFVAEIGGSTTRVLLTGIGATAADAAVRWALSTPVDLCISSGFAGALGPETRVGDVMAARVVRRAERELAVACDRELFAAAQAAGARRVDRFLTSERLVVSTSEKMALAGEADAVEMESFAILAEAARHGIRAATIRAASDAMETSLPFDFDLFRDASGQIRMASLLAAIARKPQRIPALLRLMRDCRLAARHLADFLDEYLILLEARLVLSQLEMATAT